MDYLEKLKVLMKQHNLTEYKLAQKADVAQSTSIPYFVKIIFRRYLRWNHC